MGDAAQTWLVPFEIVLSAGRGAQLEPVFTGSATRFKFIPFGLRCSIDFWYCKLCMYTCKVLNVKGLHQQVATKTEIFTPCYGPDPNFTKGVRPLSRPNYSIFLKVSGFASSGWKQILEITDSTLKITEMKGTEFKCSKPFCEIYSHNILL